MHKKRSFRRNVVLALVIGVVAGALAGRGACRYGDQLRQRPVGDAFAGGHNWLFGWFGRPHGLV